MLNFQLKTINNKQLLCSLVYLIKINQKLTKILINNQLLNSTVERGKTEVPVSWKITVNSFTADAKDTSEVSNAFARLHGTFAGRHLLDTFKNSNLKSLRYTFCRASPHCRSFILYISKSCRQCRGQLSIKKQIKLKLRRN